MICLPSDPAEGHWVIPPELMFTSVFANLSGSKRFILAQSLDSQALLKACIECELFLDFFFRYEEIIVPGVLRTVWGYTPTDVQWQRCVLLQQEVVLNLQETTVKEAITDYLEQFKSGLPSKSEVDEAIAKKGKGYPKMTDLEAGDKPSWKLVFWFFPNLAILVSYESMFLENHLARLWTFLPQHLEPSAIASFRAARMGRLTDATQFTKLPTIDNVSGQALRGLVKFCLQRNFFVQREEKHHNKHPLPSNLWCTEDRIDLVSMEIGYWLYENYTIEVIEEMHQIYRSLESSLTQLWRCACEYAIEDATKDAERKPFFSQNAQLDPDSIGPDSELVEDVVCKEAIERLLVTLGSSRPNCKISRRSVFLLHAQKYRTNLNHRFNVNNNFTIVNLDDFIWYFMESNPVNYTLRPTVTFRNFLKKWRSETILRQTLGAANYAWTNQRDADFFEKTIRQVNGLHQQMEEKVRQTAMRIAVAKHVHRPKRGFINIINSVKDSMKPSHSGESWEDLLTLGQTEVLHWKKVEAYNPRDGEYSESGSVKCVNHAPTPKNYVYKKLPPLYPTKSPVPESELGRLQDIVLSQNRLDDKKYQ